MWSPGGSEVFYRSPITDQMFAVSVDTGGSGGLRAEAPRMLFDQRYLDVGPAGPHYDISRNGDRFLLLTIDEGDTMQTNLSVTLNWFRELEQLVPTK